MYSAVTLTNTTPLEMGIQFEPTHKQKAIDILKEYNVLM